VDIFWVAENPFRLTQEEAQKMKKIAPIFAISLLFLSLLVPRVANASIAGHFYPRENDRLSVFIKDGRPFLKVEVQNFPDLPECRGFQLYQTTPFERAALELISGPEGKGTGFALWKSKECIEAYWAGSGVGRRVLMKNLVQEIDIYNDFFSYFTNKEDLIRGFEAGEFFLTVMYQENYTEYAWIPREVFYTYQEAVAGKVLLGAQDPSTQQEQFRLMPHSYTVGAFLCRTKPWHKKPFILHKIGSPASLKLRRTSNPPSLKLRTGKRLCIKIASEVVG